MEYVKLTLIVLNIFLFLTYGIDKAKAKRRKRRISEQTLILPAFLFASLGAMLGMIVFNHKTSKTKFRACIPLAFLANVLCAVALKIYL